MNRIIHDKLKAIALSVPGINGFNKGERFYQDIKELTEAEVLYPCLWITDIITTNKSGKFFSGLSKEYTILGGLTIATQDNDSASDIDSTLSQLDDTINKAALLGDLFNQAILQDKDLIEGFDFKYNEEKHLFGSNESGIIFAFTAKFMEVIPDICL